MSDTLRISGFTDDVIFAARRRRQAETARLTLTRRIGLVCEMKLLSQTCLSVCTCVSIYLFGLYKMQPHRLFICSGQCSSVADGPSLTTYSVNFVNAI